MAVISTLDPVALRNLRFLLLRAGDTAGAADVTRELLRRVAMGQILPSDIMCDTMNRHRIKDMTWGKERRWQEGRISTGRMKRRVWEASRSAYS